jgi:hypothetical protein
MSQVQPTLQPPYPVIRNCLLNGRVISFLGSGASLVKRKPDAAWSKCLEMQLRNAAQLDCYLRREYGEKVSPQRAYLPTAAELACYLARMTEFPPDERPPAISSSWSRLRRWPRQSGRGRKSMSGGSKQNASAQKNSSDGSRSK